MASSPLPLAIFVVFIAGGAVGGGTAALMLRCQASQSAQLGQRPAPSEQSREPRLSHPLDAPRPVKDASTRASSSRPPQDDRAPNEPEGELDPGTGAWLTDSLAQLEQKYQAMLQHSELPLGTREGEMLSPSETTGLRAAPGAPLSEPPSVQTAPGPEQPTPAALSPEPAPTYITQADITQSTSQTTNITQVNQTVLMGYVPLLVPVPTTQGQAGSNSAPVVPPTTTTPWVGLSPWAPIDMSRHHNPWKSSRFP